MCTLIHVNFFYFFRHDGHFSDDLQFAIDGVTHIVTLTFFGAGVLGGMNARHEWRELNQATVFQTKFRALVGTK